jgi:hypothetical protein
MASSMPMSTLSLALSDLLFILFLDFFQVFTSLQIPVSSSNSLIEKDVC